MVFSDTIADININSFLSYFQCSEKVVYLCPDRQLS
ncbi:MAG: hypothetical protein ACI9U0_001251, partial [Flavobacteriales bacterium]